MKRLLIAAAAACALDSAAMANDLSFTWDYTGITMDTPRSLCGDDWHGCVPEIHDVYGTFTLTVPDDTYSDTQDVVKGGLGIETISFHTSGGKLWFYKETDNFLATSDMSWRYLLVNTDGGMEYSYIGEPDGYVTSRSEITIGKGVSPVGPGSAPVPEPGPALLLVTGLAVLAARGRQEKGRFAC